MTMICSSEKIEALGLVGGKGRNLQRLVSWKANVAPFFVISTEEHKSYLLSGKISTSVKEKLKDFLTQHKTIALRSSMVGEDHENASFAGMFDTVLGVTENSWESALKQVYASAESQRVKEYLKQKKITSSLQMAVVVQKEIRVEKSGVLFTRSPVAPTSAIVIDAALGMGEGVVSGHASVDHYKILRTGEVLSEQLAETDPVLNANERQVLSKESLRLEEFNQGPADIEWGFAQNSLYVFQIRPITRKFEKLKVFADTNLSESYPGIVSPFTASFVKKAYENVFTESAIILGAKGERLSLLKRHYAKLISQVDDHLYYDLEHYYAVLRALPGGESNISNWHRMIGGELKGVDVPYHETKLSLLENLQALSTLVLFAFRKNGVYSDFLKNLESMSGDITTQLKSLNDSRSLMRYLSELIERPLGFGLTVVNDVYIMMGLGFLTKTIEKKGLPPARVLDLLKTDRGLDSIRPLEAFNSMLNTFSPNFLQELEAMPALQSSDPYSQFLSTMISKGFKIEADSLAKFVREFGDRSFEELKIESLPLKNDSKLLLDLIRWGYEHAAQTRNAVEIQGQLKLGGLGKKILKFTRECIEMREASRLWRGKYYHLLREIILKLVEQLRAEDARWKKFSLQDFFSIDHHEWLSFADGKFSPNEIEHLMLSRRGWQVKHRSYPEILAWVPSEELPVLLNRVQLGELRGQGVSAGKVRAKALVLERPTDALESELTDFILVTKNTDPAWVYIMSRSKGLISEKGSLLSHTAIIGRELGIPTLVGVRSATNLLKTGDLIEIDGTTGEIARV